VCRKREKRKKAKLEKATPASSVYEEALSFPLMDIQAIFGDKSGSVMTVWTGETTHHDFYIDERNGFDAILEALVNAKSPCLDKSS
jgi:hypothetical protein